MLGRSFLAIASGAALAASFPPRDIAPLAWVALWPLLEALRGRGLVERLALGTLTGLVWAAGITSSWLADAAASHLAPGPLGGALLAGAAGYLFGGIYLAALAAVYPVAPPPRWLSVPAVWVLLEAARAVVLGGAPWALLGHTQHSVLALAQLAELGGVTGLSFLVAMPAAALAARGRERLVGLAVWIACAAAAFAFGERRLAAWPAVPDAAAPGALRVVGIGGLADAPDPVSAYADAAEGSRAAALTVWPEGALPGYLQESPAVFRRIAATARSRGWLLLGARHYRGAGEARRYFNSALLLGPDGARHGLYTKAKLVPFAERSPWPFPSLVERPYEPGDARPAPLRAGDLRIGVMICWESIFAEPTRSYARAGVDLLVNLTSDRDLGDGAAQHLAFTRFRAIEARRWLLRVSGAGRTVAIDPAGRVHDRSDVVVTPVSAPPGLAVRAGGLVPVASALVLAAALVRDARRRRAHPKATRS